MREGTKRPISHCTTLASVLLLSIPVLFLSSLFFFHVQVTALTVPKILSHFLCVSTLYFFSPNFRILRLLQYLLCPPLPIEFFYFLLGSKPFFGTLLTVLQSISSPMSSTYSCTLCCPLFSLYYSPLPSSIAVKLHHRTLWATEFDIPLPSIVMSYHHQFFHIHSPFSY